MVFHNNPAIQNEHGVTQRKQYSHQEITIDHFGMQASIKENGKVIIRSVPKAIPGTDEVEYDEVTVPAGLIFKLAMYLKDTRKIEYVDEVVKPSIIADKT